MEPVDQLDRPLRDLRLSVTDRCNFRCRYCMPRELFGPDHAFLEREELLSFEELTRLTRVLTGLGVRKVRLTGGEPLLRRDLDRLVSWLAAIPGIEDLALTTNGSLLPQHAPALAAAGLRRVTVSLDALDAPTFAAMADTRVPVEAVLEGIDAAAAAGFAPVKVNAVVRRGVNEHAIDDLAAWGRRTGHTVRFIEFMDVGATNGWRLEEVVPADEILARLTERWDLEPVDPATASEVAQRWRHTDGAAEIGVIASVTRPFCGACTRARVSAVGELFTCLFGAGGTDLRRPLRGGASDAELAACVAGTWRARADRYSELRSEATAGKPKVEMSYIGG